MSGQAGPRVGERRKPQPAEKTNRSRLGVSDALERKLAQASVLGQKTKPVEQKTTRSVASGMLHADQARRFAVPNLVKPLSRQDKTDGGDCRILVP